MPIVYDFLRARLEAKREPKRVPTSLAKPVKTVSVQLFTPKVDDAKKPGPPN